MIVVSFLFREDKYCAMKHGKILLRNYNKNCELDLIVKEIVLYAINTYRKTKNYSVDVKYIQLGIISQSTEKQIIYSNSDYQVFDIYINCLDADDDCHTYHYQDETGIIEYTRIPMNSLNSIHSLIQKV